MERKMENKTFLNKLIDLFNAVFHRLSLRKNKLTPKKDYYKDFYNPAFREYEKEHEYPSRYIYRLSYSDRIHRIARPKYRAYKFDRDGRYKRAKKYRNDKVREKFTELFK